MNTYVYIVQYNGPKVFSNKKDAEEFVKSKTNGIITYIQEAYNGKKYTRNPIKVKVR